MLEFYIGEENLPKDVPFIFDVEAAFPLVSMTGTDLQRKIISDVDKGEYRDERTYIDRFGCPLPYMCLSTGSKALLLLDSKKDKIINMSECGDDCLVLLSYISDGKLYFNCRLSGIPWDVDYPVMCNGKMWERISHLNGWFC